MNLSLPAIYLTTHSLNNARHQLELPSIAISCNLFMAFSNQLSVKSAFDCMT
jgi:hypothetical protein